ncbi:hypothetical protein PCE1_002477 [Barthelona sp. PCE]
MSMNVPLVKIEKDLRSNAKSEVRVVVIDILRGLTLFIMCMVNNLGDKNYAWIDHAEWNGLHLADLVFPSFLFLSGFSKFYSYKNHQKKMQHEEVKGINGKRTKKRSFITKSAIRSLKLFLIGFSLNCLGGLLFYREHFFEYIRIFGVLQRIALCNFLVTVIIVISSAISLQILMMMVIMATYVGLMLFYPVPECGTGVLDEFCSFESYFDKLVLKNHTWKRLPYDPEGFISTLTAAWSLFLGFELATFFDKYRDRATLKYLTLTLHIAADLLIMFVSLAFFPINKSIWTPSFVFSTATISTIIITVFLIVDKSIIFRKLSYPFKAFGMNPLICFVLADLLTLVFLKIQPGGTSIFTLIYHRICHFLFDNHDMLASVLNGLMYSIIWCLLAVLFDRKRIYIKV